MRLCVLSRECQGKQGGGRGGGREGGSRSPNDRTDPPTTIHMRWSSFMVPQILICLSSLTRFLLANEIIKYPPGLSTRQASLKTSRGCTRNSIVLAIRTASNESDSREGGREGSTFRSWTTRSVRLGLALISSSFTPIPTRRAGGRMEGGR